jgi:hypothetical protein
LSITRIHRSNTIDNKKNPIIKKWIKRVPQFNLNLWNEKLPKYFHIGIIVFFYPIEGENNFYCILKKQTFAKPTPTLKENVLSNLEKNVVRCT